MIEHIIGGNRGFDIIATTQDKKTIKISFDHVCDFRYAIENAWIVRYADFNKKHVHHNSSILLVKNSEFIEHYAKHACGTMPIDTIKDYLINDSVDAAVEVLTDSDPVVTELQVINSSDREL
jgi:hypothetical protein